MAAYTNVERHIKFLLKQPGIQDALSFPKSTMLVYDYLDEFRFLSWSSLCTGETSIQLKIVEPNNLLSLVLKIGKSENKIYAKGRSSFCHLNSLAHFSMWCNTTHSEPKARF